MEVKGQFEIFTLNCMFVYRKIKAGEAWETSKKKKGESLFSTFTSPESCKYRKPVCSQGLEAKHRKQAGKLLECQLLNRMAIRNGHILVPVGGVPLRGQAGGSPFFFPPHLGHPSLLAIASLQLYLLASACVVSNCFPNPKNKDGKSERALPHGGGPGPPCPPELPGLVGVQCLSVGPGGTARHWHALLFPSQALLNLAGLQLFPNRAPAGPWAAR